LAQFVFTEEQEMLRREVRRFAQRELAPGAKERSKSDDFPFELNKKVSEAGFLSIAVPKEYGGQGGDWVSLGVAIEEIARVDFGIGALSPLGPHLFNLALKSSPEELREEWIPPIVRGDIMGSFGLTEPDCGSDAAAIKTRAVRDGDDYIINGEKTSMTWGIFADVALIFAKTDPTAGARGVTCFLVPLDLPGITRSRFYDTGLKILGRGSLTMENVRIPARYRVTEEGKGFYTTMEAFDWIRIGLGLSSLAQAETALEETISYVKQRTAFGKPLAKFEGISFKIAEAATLIEIGKLFCYRTYSLIDQGLPHTKEAAMVKWWCPRTAVKIIHDFLPVFGHVGYSKDCPMEQRLRDVMGLEIADGTAEIMKIVISREILGREFMPY